MVERHPPVTDCPAPASVERPGIAQLIEELRAEQQTHWQQGQTVPVETYLEKHPVLGRHEDAVLDLIYGEVVQRCLRGDNPRAEEYFERFPLYRERLQRQFDIHRLLLQSELLDEPPTAFSCADAGAGAVEPIPAFIGRYRVITRLDEGGQAVVYRAVHPALGLDVALKLSRLPLRDAATGDRLVREGQLLVTMTHPNLARVYDLDLHEDRPFLVMEYVPGRTLEQHARQAPLSPRTAADLVGRVAGALAVAHQRGVVHHDVKPSNILVDPSGRPLLIDFGLALLRSAWTVESFPAGSVWGSAQYMAPEQARGERECIDHRADIFGLGGMLYFLLVGQPPLPGSNPREVLDRARRCDWDRQTLQAARAPRRLKAICARALAAEPSARYACAEDLAADLRAWLRRPRLLALGSAIAAVALLISAFLVTRPAWLRFGGSPTVPAPVPHGVSEAIASRQQGVEERLPSLTLRIWRKVRYVELIDAVPLHSGAELRVCATAPEGLYTTLFLIGGSRKLRRLCDLPVNPASRTLCYPAKEDQSVPLVGPAGTELVLVCGCRTGPMEEVELRRWLEEGRTWAVLPGESVLRLKRDRVIVEQHGRDFGAPRDRPDPEGEVRRQLEDLRQRLRDHFDYFEGLAFAHEE
jgi:hypothetical protein